MTATATTTAPAELRAVERKSEEEIAQALSAMSRHGFIVYSKAGIAIGWHITLHGALEVPNAAEIANVQNGGIIKVR